MAVLRMSDDWYEHPSVYDILHAAGTAEEVTGLERIERRFSRSVRGGRRRWLEPACGSGRYLRVAAGRGVRVMGFDRERRMVEYAREGFRRRGLRGDHWVADLERFRAPVRATFAFCPINTLRHLGSDGAVLAHLGCMRRALAPGAVYAVGLETCRYGVDFPSEDVWEGSRGRVHVHQLISYRPATRRVRAERVHSILTITTPGGSRELITRYTLRSYSFGEWRGLVRRAGWRILGMCDARGADALVGPSGEPVGGYALYVLGPVPAESRSGGEGVRPIK
jgi:SAM-dependent methyltransferase